MDGAPCDAAGPRRGGHRALMWRGLGRRRKLPVVRLGGGGGGGGGGRRGGGGRGRGRGVLRLRWLAAIYVAALTGPPHTSASASASSLSCQPWIGAEPLFAVPFMPNVRPFL